MADEPISDLDVELAIWRECEGALSALQGAFQRAREVMPGLPLPAREVARVELARIARTTGILILRCAFPEYVNEKETP